MNTQRAVEVTLVLLRTRPWGRRPDGLNRWADLRLLLEGCGLDIDRGTVLNADEQQQAVVDVRWMRDVLGVPSHYVGDSRLVGGRPSSALWLRSVL